MKMNPTDKYGNLLYKGLYVESKTLIPIDVFVHKIKNGIAICNFHTLYYSGSTSLIRKDDYYEKGLR